MNYENNILHRTQVMLENDIDDLMLPYTFDISIYHHIKNEDLLDHIARVGKGFFVREDFKSSLKAQKN